MKAKVDVTKLACRYGSYCSYIANLKKGWGDTAFYLAHCSKANAGCQFKSGLVTQEHLNPSKLVRAAIAGA